MPVEIAGLAAQFARRGDISARSVLVTVFGDTIAPLGGTVWLSDLFDLLAPFPFTERLLRTSMSRLVAEGWCVPEKVGRRSRYALTDAAASATAEASRLIYSRSDHDCTGEWTVVFVEDDDAMSTRLQWHGFARLARAVVAMPDDGSGRAGSILDSYDVSSRYPVATARFSNLEVLGAGGRISAGPEFADLVAGYERFVQHYSTLEASALEKLGSADAFAVRTMVVHELRRLRLRDPDLPAGLLPSPWIGAEAFQLAARLYRIVDAGAWRWVCSKTSTDPGKIDTEVAQRFA